MPRGSSGRMLCLFSGGIDSPVAAWKLMRRGGLVDLLHFHPFRTGAEVLNSKITEIHAALQRFHPATRLYLLPHYPFQVTAGMGAPPSLELVLFRRFMWKTAEEFALKHGAAAAYDSRQSPADQRARTARRAASPLSEGRALPLRVAGDHSRARRRSRTRTGFPRWALHGAGRSLSTGGGAPRPAARRVDPGRLRGTGHQDDGYRRATRRRRGSGRRASAPDDD